MRSPRRSGRAGSWPVAGDEARYADQPHCKDAQVNLFDVIAALYGAAVLAFFLGRRRIGQVLTAAAVLATVVPVLVDGDFYVEQAQQFGRTRLTPVVTWMSTTITRITTGASSE